MANLKNNTTFAGIRITSGPLLGPQNSTNQAGSGTGQTNFVSGGGTIDDSQWFGSIRVIYDY